MQLPQLNKVYQNHHLDSTRWDAYSPRNDDIVVTTSYKCGTTYTQQILLHLLHGGPDVDAPATLDVSPWIDARFMPTPLETLIEDIDDQKPRRFIKSHLPLDGLPYYEQVKYLIVARDPRDVFMSLQNHYGNYTDLAYSAFNNGNVGVDLPRFDPDIKRSWTNWISRGWFDWESEGWPMWSNMHHTQSNWEYRNLPNFMFLHYADMRSDLPGTIRRIAEFIEHPVTDADVARVTSETDFDAVKAKAVKADAEADTNSPQVFANGQSGFFFKGTNGRWRNVLDQEVLELYEAAKRRVLSDDCAAWLENGGAV